MEVFVFGTKTFIAAALSQYISAELRSTKRQCSNQLDAFLADVHVLLYNLATLSLYFGQRSVHDG